LRWQAGDFRIDLWHARVFSNHHVREYERDYIVFSIPEDRSISRSADLRNAINCLKIIRDPPLSSIQSNDIT
jgi:hypothetical protein